MKQNKNKLNFIILLIALSSSYASAQTQAVTQSSASPKAQDLISQSTGNKPGKEMKMKKGVPTYSVSVKTKNIPRLNIGEESTFSANPQTLKKPEIKAMTLPTVSKDQIPAKIDIRQHTRTSIKPAAKQTNFVQINPQFQAPLVKPLKEIADPNFKESEPKLTELNIFSASEEKMLQALIFLEIHKMSNMAIGLLSEVMQESKELKNEATYQFALTAKNLGLANDHRFYMLQLLKNGTKDQQKRALISLATNALEGDLDIVAQIDNRLSEFGIDLENADQYQLNRSRYYAGKNDLTPALASIEEIGNQSTLFADGQFMKSIILYRAGKLQESSEIMLATLATLEKTAPQSELKSVAALTLARQYFQLGKYQDAFQAYLKVNKNNPIWTQAMMEQAWTQILSEDYEGASGNMYTLHTDFFRNAFAPESYIVRTVGYLNLCQYGDGAKAIYSLQHRYSPMKDMLEQYQKKNQNDTNYYDTVKSFFQNKDLKVVDGLHRNFVYELARHPSFMNEQKTVNQAEEQIEKYNKISFDLINAEKTFLQKQAELEQKLVTATKNKQKTEIITITKKIAATKYQYQVAKRARTSIKEIRQSGVARLDADKVIFKKRAAHALKRRFDEMLKIVSKTLEQAEVLRYELYSGAGEHLRYQLAGGEVTDKEREVLKAKEGQSLKWDFKGEVWEDELGHYRSGLKNVCAK